MSRYNGSRVVGSPPPFIPKMKSGTPRPRPNKYADVKPSDEKNTTGQRRARRKAAPAEVFIDDAINQIGHRTPR